MLHSREPSAHACRLAPVAVRDNEVDRPGVFIQEGAAQNPGLIPGIQEQGSTICRVEILKVERLILVALDAKFAVAECGKGQRPGCSRLGPLTVMHHQDEPGGKIEPGDGAAEAEACVQTALRTTFASF
jgi:hypothetical protein